MRKPAVVGLLAALALCAGLIVGPAAPARAGVSWKFTVIDGPTSTVPGHLTDGVAFQTATVTVNGVTHLLYGALNGSSVRHAKRVNGTWQVQTIDGLGGPNPATTGSNMSNFTLVAAGNTVHAFYMNTTTGSLRHATLNGNTWSFEYVDGTSASHSGRTQHVVGQFATAVYYDNTYHVFYSDSTAASLRHAWWDNNKWSYEWVDGPIAGTPGRTTSNAGRSLSATVDGSGNVRLAYATYYPGLGPRGLRFATRQSGAWKFRHIDGNLSTVAGRTTDPTGVNAHIVMNGGQTNIFYFDDNTNSLRRAYIANGTWTIEVIDGPTSTIAKHVSNLAKNGISAIAKNGVIRVYYAQGTSGRSLRSAVFNSGWTYRTIDGAGSPNGGISSPAGYFPTATFENGYPTVYYGGMEPASPDFTLRRAELS